MIHTRTLLCLEHCLRTYLRPQISLRSQTHYRTLKNCRVLHKNNLDDIEVFYPVKPRRGRAPSVKGKNIQPLQRHDPPRTNEDKSTKLLPTSELENAWISDMWENDIDFEKYDDNSINNVGNMDSEEVKNCSENVIKAHDEVNDFNNFFDTNENNHRFESESSILEAEKSRSNNDNALYEQNISLSNEGSEPLPSIHGHSEPLPSEEYIPDDATTPANILGDLNTLFGSSEYQQVIEEDLLVEPQSEDYVPPNYSITFYPHEGESYELEGLLEGVNEDHTQGIPINHVIQYIRENKGIETSVIEVPDNVTYVRYMIVTTVLNNRQLKHIGAGLSSMCKHEYSMVWPCPVQAELSENWVALDTGICAVHFMVPAERERMRLESLWLGLDKEASLTDEEQYNKDLLEGLFPDEDFTKLAKPWELQYEED